MANTKYELAKAAREALDAEVRSAGDALKPFPRGAMGLVPDAVRATPEWKSAKQRYDLAFGRSQSFNRWFCKAFEREYREERRGRAA